MLNFDNLKYTKTVSADVPYPFVANVCYKYETTANSRLCVLSDLLGKTGSTGICKVNEIKTVANSGAPVQVTSMIETAIAKDKISFTFKIGHKGIGTIFKTAMADPICDPNEITNRNKVKVTVNTGYNSGLTCSGLDANGRFGGEGGSG